MRADHLAIATIVIATVGGIAGLAGYALSDSPATLGFALENVLNVISALIILWRFRGGWVAFPAPFLAAQREERARVAISFCHLLIAATILVIAFAHLVAPLRLESSGMVIGLSLPAFFVFAGLAGAKFYVGFNEHLGSLKRDSACSLASALAALGAATGEAAGYETGHHHVWKGMRGLWIDVLISAAVAVGLAYYGLSSLLESASQGYEWWKPPFWNGAPSPSLSSLASLRSRVGFVAPSVSWRCSPLPHRSFQPRQPPPAYNSHERHVRGQASGVSTDLIVYPGSPHLEPIHACQSCMLSSAPLLKGPQVRSAPHKPPFLLAVELGAKLLDALA